VPFDDSAALARGRRRRSGETLAAIIVEPLVHHIASRAWLQTARGCAIERGTVLIFDEVKTAFRVRTGGVQALLRHHPRPHHHRQGARQRVSAGGRGGARADAMASAHRTWISSTLPPRRRRSPRRGLCSSGTIALDVCGALDRIGAGRCSRSVRDGARRTPSVGGERTGRR
jgi:glutamate-1-semialdehyde 2,1-aminomutase